MEANNEIRNREDRLDCIWNRQLKFNNNFFDSEKTTIEEKQEKTKLFVLHVTEECHEVLREINWKMHRVTERPVDMTKILEECIDVQKFLMGIMQIWGFSSTEFYEMFMKKSHVVEERFSKGKNNESN